MNTLLKISIALALFSCKKEQQPCDCKEKHYQMQLNSSAVLYPELVYESQYSKMDCSNNGKKVETGNYKYYIIECK